MPVTEAIMPVDNVLSLLTRRDVAILHRDQLKIDLVSTSSLVRRLDKEIARAAVLEAQHGEQLVISAQRVQYEAGRKSNLWEAVQYAFSLAGPRDKMAIQAAFPNMAVAVGASASTPPKSAGVTNAPTDAPRATSLLNPDVSPEK